MTFLHVEEFERVYHDASTPPHDRADVLRALRACADSHDPRDWLVEPSGYRELLELVVVAATSGHRYGIVFIDFGHAADAVAYWRDPPLEGNQACMHDARRVGHQRRRGAR